MGVYSPETLFNVAKNKYAECEEIISEIVSIVQGVDVDISLESSMINFDLIIQTCMLSGAVQNGYFEHNEKVFVRDITKYGDLLGLLNHEFKKEMAEWRDISWDDIDGLDAGNKAVLSSLAVKIVEPAVSGFVGVMALVDKIVTEKDYMQLLYDRVGQMLVVLSGIDGDDLDSNEANAENRVSYNIYNQIVNDAWKREMNK